MSKNIALLGGGTAGHIMPNLALLPYLAERFERIIYIGSNDSMEERICKEQNIPYYATETMKFYRNKIWKNATLPMVLFRGIREAKNILKSNKIDLVFSKGGYAAVPTVIAARRMHLCIACHESDKTMGLANRLTAKIADKVYTAFPNTYPNAKVMPTPIRDGIFNGNPFFPFQNKNKKTLLFMGGSLGAEAINDALSEAFSIISDKYNILHISGKSGARLKTPSYWSAPFVNDIENYFATADLIVCRAGASTLGELTALGKRVLAIPLPKGESRGDQEENAAYYLSKGAISVLPQECLHPDRLLEAIDQSMMNRPPAPAYDRNTPKMIAEELYEIAKSTEN